MTEIAQFIWFTPCQRHGGPAMAWLTSQPMRKLCVTSSSYSSPAAPPGRANRSRAAAARLGPSARSVAGMLATKRA
jgi:hypothetical protein